MFQFALDDGSIGSKSTRRQNIRMTGLRHNPYVGSFHGINSHLFDNDRTRSNILSKNNPLVGSFRHSPSLPSKSLGLKSILYETNTAPPVISQLEVSREAKPIPTHNFLRSFRQIPSRVYSASSVCSKSSHSPRDCADADGGVEERCSDRGDAGGDGGDDDVPMCAICITPYADGDELRTLACSHCYHNECVSKWIFTRCLNNADMESFNCPECRQNHVTLSEAGSSSASLAAQAQGISDLSFLQVGENIAQDAGYDFLSDFGGSDMQSPSAPLSVRSSCRSFTPAPPSSASATAVAAAATSGARRRSPTSPITPSSTSSEDVSVGLNLDHLEEGEPDSDMDINKNKSITDGAIAGSPMMRSPIQSSFGVCGSPLNRPPIFRFPVNVSTSTNSGTAMDGSCVVVGASVFNDMSPRGESESPVAAIPVSPAPTDGTEDNDILAELPHIHTTSALAKTLDSDLPVAHPLCASLYSDCGTPLDADNED